MALTKPTDRDMEGIFNTEYRKFQWPTVGSLQHMRQWTFQQGAATLEARSYRYGRDAEAPPLSPKSRLVHITLEEPLVSPTTVLDRAPRYDSDDEAEFPASFLDEDDNGEC